MKHLLHFHLTALLVRSRYTNYYIVMLLLGALFVKSPSKETPLYPVLFGGGQERGFRPGTENTGMIAGLGEAAQLVVENLETYSTHMRQVRLKIK